MAIPDISSSIFQPLEDAIYPQIHPSSNWSGVQLTRRKLLSLPTRLGGLNTVEITESQLKASKVITILLKKMIIEQSDQFTKPQLVKSALHRKKRQTNAAKVRVEISAALQRAMDLDTKKGASTWFDCPTIAGAGLHTQ